ncbi:MAG: C10 family peptidase [Muribaculaceae bacterium]|nr:C10 family peptidase [Muribaculaceae bacterium]
MNKSSLTFLAILSFFITSCSQNELPDFTEVECLNESLNVKSIKRYIEQKHPVKSRSNTQLIPIIQTGDTVAFLANYSEGWELFSNNTSLPMVLMKSENGNFYPNVGILSEEEGAPFMSFYNSLIDGLVSYSEEDDINPVWALYNEDGDRGGDQVPQWVGYAATVERESYTPKGGRLKTQWNQTKNYNLFTPFRSDSTNIHALVGCGAIASGQMVYHSNKHFGVPITTETKAIYNPEGNRYEFSELSSSIWSLMDSGEDESFCNDPVKMIPTAVFLGNVANSIKTVFQTIDIAGSLSQPRNIIPFLSEVLNVQFSNEKMNWTDVIYTLKKGYPVLTSSYNNIIMSQKVMGHTYLIDKADLYRETLYDVYDIRTSDNNPYYDDMEDREEQGGDPENVAHSLDYYREVYGDIQYSYNSMITERWLMMNWGVAKSLNNVKINADDKIIKISSSQFDTNIIYKVN